MLFAHLMMLTFESADEAAQCDKFISDTSRSFRDKYSTSIVCLSHLNDKNSMPLLHAKFISLFTQLSDSDSSIYCWN